MLFCWLVLLSSKSNKQSKETRSLATGASLLSIIQQKTKANYMLKPPYRLFVNNIEMRTTGRYSRNVVVKKIQSVGGTCVVRFEQTIASEDNTEEPTTKIIEGRYCVVGRLRPALYHIGGDNPLEAPAPVRHKQANLAPCMGRKIKTTASNLENNRNDGNYIITKDNHV